MKQNMYMYDRILSILHGLGYRAGDQMSTFAFVKELEEFGIDTDDLGDPMEFYKFSKIMIG